MPEEPKRKQAKKNVVFEDKTAENNNANVTSFKVKKPTSPQKDPIRTNTNKASTEEKPTEQETNNTASKSPKSESKDEHQICPPGFINVLQSRMVFDWFKELMRCREDSIGVGMLLECHSTNFQKSLYFVSPTRSIHAFVNSLLENEMRGLWWRLFQAPYRNWLPFLEVNEALFLAVSSHRNWRGVQALHWRLFGGILFFARAQTVLQRQRMS